MIIRLPDEAKLKYKCLSHNVISFSQGLKVAKFQQSSLTTLETAGESQNGSHKAFSFLQRDIGPRVL